MARILSGIGQGVKDFYFTGGKARKGRIGLTIGGLAVVAAAIWGASSLGKRINDDNGTVVYDGKVDGIGRVVYTEGVGRGRDESNILELTKGRDEYKFVDEDGRPLDWNVAVVRPFDDKVESLIYTDARGTHSYNRTEVGNGTYTGSLVGALFDDADRAYNRTREKIRAKLRAEEEATIGKAKAGLSFDN
jgi:hypothetical protein